MGSQHITTPDELPPGTTRLGPLVAWEQDGPRGDGVYPVCVWHWCTKSGWRAKAAREGWVVVEEAAQPAWLPSSASAHDLISLDPLHLEPSVYWPECCGLHGFIRAGRWTDA